eukprot:Skav201445  [mRNA]  locus=scaffold6:145091:160746:+ [translate_table: standard]
MVAPAPAEAVETVLSSTMAPQADAKTSSAAVKEAEAPIHGVSAKSPPSMEKKLEKLHRLEDKLKKEKAKLRLKKQLSMPQKAERAGSGSHANEAVKPWRARKPVDEAPEAWMWWTGPGLPERIPGGLRRRAQRAEGHRVVDWKQGRRSDRVFGRGTLRTAGSSTADQTTQPEDGEAVEPSSRTTPSPTRDSLDGGKVDGTSVSTEVDVQIDEINDKMDSLSQRIKRVGRKTKTLEDLNHAHAWKLEDIDQKVDQLAKKLGDSKVENMESLRGKIDHLLKSVKEADAVVKEDRRKQ